MAKTLDPSDIDNQAQESMAEAGYVQAVQMPISRRMVPKAIPAGYTQTERKVAVLYSPVDPSLLTGLLSGNSGLPIGYPGSPTREVRVRMGKLEVWEKVIN